MGNNEAAEPEYATAKIAVWWDMNDCPVPEGYNARRVRPSMEAAFKKLGYAGPVSITAYGDQKQTPGHLLRELSSSGVSVAHTIPKNICSAMFSDMLCWRGHNPPPATMMVISDHIEEFLCWDLARLQQDTKYNFFQAFSFRSCYDSTLVHSANWVWQRLLKSRSRSGDETRSDARSELSGLFYCKSCSFDCQSLASFRKHLLSSKHGVKERRNSGNGELDPVTRMWGMNYPAKPEYATAPIMIWWDMADCPVPEGYDPRRVRPSIEQEFKKLGYSGPVSITAFGDHKETPDHLLQGLSSTGVSVAHIIRGSMYSDMREWRDDNPPPATMMIISNDVEEAYSHFLVEDQQETKYNLFLAYSFRPYKMSILVTSAEWLWDHLLAVSETMGQVVHKCNESGESTGMLSSGQVVRLCSERGESTGMLSSGQVVRMCSESGEPTGMLSRGQVLRKCSESGESTGMLSRGQVVPMCNEYGESTGMLSRGQVLRKCSESGESTGMFYCKSCNWDCKGLDGFRKHLSSENHAQKEAGMYSRMRLSEQEQEECIKEYYLPKRKRLRKASRTGFGRFHNHLSRTTT